MRTIQFPFIVFGQYGDSLMVAEGTKRNSRELEEWAIRHTNRMTWTLANLQSKLKNVGCWLSVNNE